MTHFAWGIGDDNPLWRADGHTGPPYTTVVAPPCFAYAAHETTVAPGHDDHRRIYAHVDWVWFDRIRGGTDLLASARLIDETKGPEGLVQVGQVDFRSSGSVIAVATTRCNRVAGPPPDPAGRPEVRYGPEQLDAIEEAILSESRRGPVDRRLGDVEVGQTLGSLTKGPLSIMDVVAWCAGTQGVATPADRLSEGGLVAESATGPQVVAWIGQLVGDWMGDAGFLHELSVSIDHLPPLGSTTTISGDVQGIADAGGVRLRARASDQEDRTVASATATVLLPTADAGVGLPVVS